MGCCGSSDEVVLDHNERRASKTALKITPSNSRRSSVASQSAAAEQAKKEFELELEKKSVGNDNNNNNNNMKTTTNTTTKDTTNIGANNNNSNNGHHDDDGAPPSSPADLARTGNFATASAEDKYKVFYDENGEAVDENGVLLRVTTREAREALKKGISALEEFDEKSNPRDRRRCGHEQDDETPAGTASDDPVETEEVKHQREIAKQLHFRAQSLILQSHDLKEKYDEHLARKIKEEGGQVGAGDDVDAVDDDDDFVDPEISELQKQRQQRKRARRRRNSKLFPEMVIGDHFSPIVRRVGEVLQEATRDNNNEEENQKEIPVQQDEEDEDDPNRSHTNNNNNNNNNSKKNKKKTFTRQPLTNEDRQRKLDIASDLITASIAQFEQLELKMMKMSKNKNPDEAEQKTNGTVYEQDDDGKEKNSRNNSSPHEKNQELLLLIDSRGNKYYIDEDTGKWIYPHVLARDDDDDGNKAKKTKNIQNSSQGGRNSNEADDEYDELFYDDEGNPYILDKNEEGRRIYTDDPKREILVDDGGNCYYLDDNGLRIYTHGCKRDDAGRHFYTSVNGSKIYTNVDSIDHGKNTAPTTEDTTTSSKTKPEGNMSIDDPKTGNGKIYSTISTDEKTGVKYYLDEEGNRVQVVGGDGGGGGGGSNCSTTVSNANENYLKNGDGGGGGPTSPEARAAAAKFVSPETVLDKNSGAAAKSSKKASPAPSLSPTSPVSPSIKANNSQKKRPPQFSTPASSSPKNQSLKQHAKSPSSPLARSKGSAAEVIPSSPAPSTPGTKSTYNPSKHVVGSPSQSPPALLQQQQRQKSDFAPKPATSPIRSPNKKLSGTNSKSVVGQQQAEEVEENLLGNTSMKRERPTSPNSAVLDCIHNSPSFIDLDADQPRDSVFRADDALLDNLRHDQQSDENISPNTTITTATSTATCSKENESQILQHVAHALAKMKGLLFNAKQKREHDQPRSAAAVAAACSSSASPSPTDSRQQPQDHRHHQRKGPSSPGLLGLSRNILHANEGGKNDHNNDNSPRNHSSSSASSPAPGAASSPLSATASTPVFVAKYGQKTGRAHGTRQPLPVSVMEVRRLLKELTNLQNKNGAERANSKLMQEAQEALQRFRNDVDEKKFEEQGDKEFLQSVLGHYEKMFRVMTTMVRSNLTNENEMPSYADHYNKHNNNNNCTVSQQLVAMTSAIDNVHPDKLSTMNEQEKDLTVRRADEAIQRVVDEADRQHRVANDFLINNNNDDDGFSPREQQQPPSSSSSRQQQEEILPSSPVKQPLPVINALSTLRDVVCESAKWFNDDLKKQSLRRITSFDNGNRQKMQLHQYGSLSAISEVSSFNNTTAKSSAAAAAVSNKSPQRESNLNCNNNNKNAVGEVGEEANTNNNNNNNEIKKDPDQKDNQDGTLFKKSSFLLQQKKSSDKKKMQAGSAQQLRVFRPRSPTTNNILTKAITIPRSVIAGTNANNDALSHPTEIVIPSDDRDATTTTTNAKTKTNSSNDYCDRGKKSSPSSPSSSSWSLQSTSPMNLPIESLPPDQRRTILLCDEALLNAARVRVSSLTHQQKQHTSQALNKSAEVMEILKMEIVKYAGAMIESRPLHNINHAMNRKEGNEPILRPSLPLPLPPPLSSSPFASAVAVADSFATSPTFPQNRKPLAALERVRSVLAEVSRGTLAGDGNTNTTNGLSAEEQFSLAREIVRGVQSEMDETYLSVDKNVDDRAKDVNAILNHYAGALHLMELASFSSLAKVESSQKSQQGLHPGSSTAQAVASLGDTLDQLKNLVLTKIRGGNTSSVGDEGPRPPLPTTTAKTTTNSHFVKSTVTSDNNESSVVEFSDLPTQDRTRIIAQAKSLIAQGMKKLSPLGVEEQRNILPVFDAITNLLRSVASCASSVALRQHVEDRTAAVNNLNSEFYHRQNNYSNSNIRNGNIGASVAKPSTNGTNETDSHDASSFSSDVVGRAQKTQQQRAAPTSNNNNNNSNNNGCANKPRPKNPKRVLPKPAIPHMVYPDLEHEASVISRYVAPVGRIDRFGVGKQSCDLCVEFPSGLARVVLHDNSFSEWQRVKGNVLMGQISQAAQDFAAHGGLMQNRTANMYCLDDDDDNDVVAPSAHEQVKNLEMLRFEKWDWRRAK